MSRYSGHLLFHHPSRKKNKQRKHFILLLWGFFLFAGGFSLAQVSVEPGDEASDHGEVVSVFRQGHGGINAEIAVPELGDDPAGKKYDAEAAWNLILVNSEQPLPDDFQIPELTQLRGGHSIDSRAYPALQSMMDAAREAGLQPLICSSYRTRDKQNELFSRKVQFYIDQGFTQMAAEENAARWVARPGTSEHQVGLAVDIVDMSYQLLDKQQENTPVQIWLMEHCAEYGFILRYPQDKSEWTGVEYEPWHYRYVGVDAAMEIMDQGLSLEEYLLAKK